jgi:tripartite-type tricarboxylate transporter receptor subunit TctC
MIRRGHTIAVGLVAILTLASNTATAQQKYPERPIKLVVPFPPGGMFDPIGRLLAERLNGTLGTVVVENVGGGGGTIGAAAVARAAADGHTLLLAGSGSLIVSSIAAARPLYHPTRDFESIAIIAKTAWAFVVNPSVPAQSLADLVLYGKQHPGKLSYGSAGVGSGPHLVGELFKSRTGLTDIVHTPYRGAGPALADLVGGHIPFATPAVTRQIIELNRAGKVRVLAVTAASRLKAAPEIPTVTEAGMPDLVSQGIMGVFAPGGTQRSIVDQIARAIGKIMADPEVHDRLVAAGLEAVVSSTPEVTRRHLDAEIAHWAPLVRAINLRLD